LVVAAPGGAAYDGRVFPEGEGAQATGPLVAVFAPRSLSDAEVVIRLLESHHIPALWSDSLPAAWGLSPSRGEILVPASMRAAAVEVLQTRIRRRTRGNAHPQRSNPRSPERPASGGPDASAAGANSEPATSARGATSSKTGAGASPSSAISNPEPIPWHPPQVAWGRPEARPVPAVGEADPSPNPVGGDLEVDLEGPTEAPEGLSEVQRWWAALSLFAITFGIAVQVGFDRWFGPGSAIGHFGATARSWPELERWITAGFIHGSSAHAIGNAIFGLLIGWAVFQTHGVGATACVWLLSSAVGIAAQTGLHPESLVIGASAGNYGLVGLWARGQWERSRTRVLPRRELLRTLGVLALLIPGAFTPFTSDGTPIAVAAHALGFGAGAMSGFMFPRRLSPQGVAPLEQRSRAAGWFTVTVVVVAFLWSLGRVG